MKRLGCMALAAIVGAIVGFWVWVESGTCRAEGFPCTLDMAVRPMVVAAIVAVLLTFWLTKKDKSDSD